MELFKLEFTFFDGVSWSRVTKTVIADSLKQLEISVNEELKWQRNSSFTFESFSKDVEKVKLPLIFTLEFL